MRRLALLAVALLLIAWHSSPGKMAAAQRSSLSQPPPSDDQDDDPPAHSQLPPGDEEDDDDPPVRNSLPPSRDDEGDDPPVHNSMPPPRDDEGDDPPAHSLPPPRDDEGDDPPTHSLPPPRDDEGDDPPVHSLPPPRDDEGDGDDPPVRRHHLLPSPPPRDNEDDDPPVHSLPPPRDDAGDGDDPPVRRHHLSAPPPPPEELNAPEPLVPESPPPPELEPPAPIVPPPTREVPPPPRYDEPQEPEPTVPPHPGQDPPPPRREPTPPRMVVTPPRTVVPPQEPGWAAVPLPLPPPPPASARVINYTATGYTTMLVFGDSTVDPGNNNRLQTTMRANFLPYGTSFLGGRPTGRFSNGRLITDMLAEKLGIAMTIPGFHEPRLRPRQLRRGVSFASAGSGYDDATARISNALSFSNQVEDLWRYKRNLQRLVGPRRAEQLVRRATFVISAGTADVLLHYLASNRSAASWPRYESLLITRIANYTQVMRTLGGRRFVFVGVPPVGCLPIARTLLATGSGSCHENMNLLATSFNRRLAEVVHHLRNEQDTKATFIDTYTIVGMATIDPISFGLIETSRGCCGTGVIEVGQACRGRITCTDPSKYMYWDAAHQTERMNQIITDHAIMNSIGEIYV